MSEVMVSVNCLVYNHEKYLRQCLDGFVMQKTTFPFEVLVHDDASTDHSADIIREYEEKYPDIIKPIYEVENQYSKHDGSLGRIQYGRAKGKYIAICEGDDYWIDPLKLQKQFDYMQAHPDCTLCFTNAFFSGTKQGVMLPEKGRRRYLKKNSYDYDMGELEFLGFIPTASLFFPREAREGISQISERAYKGDKCLRLYLASKGYAHFIDECMSVYRVGVENSATTIWASNKEIGAAVGESSICLYNELNELTGYRYDEAMQYGVMVSKYGLYKQINDRKALKSKEIWSFVWNYYEPKYIVVHILSVYCPKIFQFLIFCRRKTKKL